MEGYDFNYERTPLLGVESNEKDISRVGEQRWARRRAARMARHWGPQKKGRYWSFPSYTHQRRRGNRHTFQCWLNDLILNTLGGLSALVLGAIAFSISACVLLIFVTAMSCFIVGKDFTESTIGLFMFSKAALLEQFIRMPFTIAAFIIRAVACIICTSINGLMGFIYVIIDILRFIYIDRIPSVHDGPWKTIWQGLPSLLLEAAIWALAVEVIVILFYLRFGNMYKKFRKRLAELVPAVKMVLRQDQSSYPSRGFVGFGEHSFAELFIIRKEEDRDIIQPKSPKRENTPVDSSDDDTGFVAYGAMTYNDDDDEYSHGGLFDPVEASKISSYDVGSSNERQSIEESENSENEEGGDNVQDIDDEGDEDFLKQLWSTRELNGFIPSNLEKKVMKSFHSNYGGDRDRNETMNNTPSSEGVELEDANSWIRKDYRANIQQHVGISGNLSQHPIESCVPSDSEPSCYEMEAITASLRDLPPPPPESSVVENSGDIDETDSLVCDSECMDEECETDEDDDWYIIAEEANKTSPTEH